MSSRWQRKGRWAGAAAIQVLIDCFVSKMIIAMLLERSSKSSYHPGGGRIQDPRGPLGLFATTLRLLSYLVLINWFFSYYFLCIPGLDQLIFLSLIATSPGWGRIRLLWKQNQTQKSAAELQHWLQQSGAAEKDEDKTMKHNVWQYGKLLKMLRNV